MVEATLDQPTRERLLLGAERIGDLIAASEDEQPRSSEGSTARGARRMAWYREIEDCVLDLANVTPAGTEDYEVRQLLAFLTALRRAAERDTSLRDESGELRLARMRIDDVLRRMRRGIERSSIDNPQEAAVFVAAQLGSLTATETARLLGVSPKTFGSWKSGSPVKRNRDRVCLVAQLVAYLQSSMTPRGILMWFENPSRVLGGRSPIAYMDEGIAAAWEPLVTYARSGRGQLAS